MQAVGQSVIIWASSLISQYKTIGKVLFGPGKTVDDSLDKGIKVLLQAYICDW